MPLVTFNPPVDPSPGTTHTPKVNLFEAPFGDGYSQAAPNGLNHISMTVSLRWTALTKENCDAIFAFFMNQGGFRPFWYQPYGMDDPLKWTCVEFSRTHEAPWTIDATLKQSFTNEA